MGNSWTRDSPDIDPYTVYPMEAILPSTWQKDLQYDRSKVKISYPYEEAEFDDFVQAMTANSYKTNWVSIYQQAKNYRRLGYNDPQFQTEKQIINSNHDNLYHWYNQRDETKTVTVPGTRRTHTDGMALDIITSILMDVTIRKYRTDYPESEKFIRRLNAYLYKVMQERLTPDTGPSKEANALLIRAQAIRDSYNSLANKNDPKLVNPVLKQAQDLYNEIMYRKATDPAKYERASRDTTDRAMGLLDLILREQHGHTDDNPNTGPLSDEEALRNEHFPSPEKEIVSSIYTNQLPDKLSGALSLVKDFKLYSMNNSGIIFSFVINSLLYGFSNAMVSAGATYAYKSYYKNKGTGPVSDMLSKKLLPQAASDSRFIDSIRTAKALFSDADYAAYLLLQVKLAGKTSLVGTLAGYGGSKLLAESWEAIQNIPGFGWLLGIAGESTRTILNDVSSDKYSSGFL